MSKVKKRYLKAARAVLTKGDLSGMELGARWSFAAGDSPWGSAWDSDSANDVLLAKMYLDSPDPLQRETARQIAAKPKGQRWI